MKSKKLLIIGYGVLGGKVLDEVIRAYPWLQIFVSGRDKDSLERRINLARYAALNYGHMAEVTAVPFDLLDAARSRTALKEIQPDLVFNATTPVPWWKIDQLPAELKGPMKEAGSGIWAAMDILLPWRLAQALESVEFAGTFVNGTFPDLVNPVIYNTKVGPICGVGNVANVVPGLRLAAADLLEEPVADVRIRLVAHHYLSYNLPLTGKSEGAPFSLQLLLGEEDVTHRVNFDTLFRHLATRFRRVKGVEGQAVTVSSAISVLGPLIEGGESWAHAPGLLGKPGGYPVRINGRSVDFDLPPSLNLQQAVELNLSGGRFDGIEGISESGEVTVTRRSSEIAKSVLGYEIDRVNLGNCENKAFELVERFSRLALGRRQ